METIDFIKDTEGKSASTRSRRCITISVDDTNLPRDGETLSYCSNYYSTKHKTSIWCQNVLGITLKSGSIVLPLDMRLVSKQGRGNTDKPSLVIAMLKDILTAHISSNQLQLPGERQTLIDFIAHFHQLNPKEP